MTVLVTDRAFGNELIEQRRRNGGDRFDEVWEGLYVMAPLPNDEHQELQTELAYVFRSIAEAIPGTKVRAGINVTDRRSDWTGNYRCPDVAVFMPDTSAINRETHWVGGPDLAVEIASPDDRTRDKLEFYSKVGVRELLIVDRDPWSLELLRHDGTALKSVATLTPGAAGTLASEILPLAFRLLAPAAGKRPVIHATHTTTGAIWNI